jgi:2-aminoethylphosphonate transport system permease protein
LGDDVLVWSRLGRTIVWTVAAILIGAIYVAPLAIIALASFAGEWNGIFPSKPTVAHYLGALSGDSGEQLRVSIATGIVASLLALLLGTWSALALRSLSLLPRRVLDLLLFLPSAVPSVSVGLGLLVAFSRPPLLHNGTTAISSRLLRASEHGHCIDSTGSPCR